MRTDWNEFQHLSAKLERFYFEHGQKLTRLELRRLIRLQVKYGNAYTNAAAEAA